VTGTSFTLKLKNVQLHERHLIQVAPDYFRWFPVARYIHQQTSPAEPRPVFNSQAWKIKRSGIQIHQLQSCFQTANNANGRKTYFTSLNLAIPHVA
jgi:hypothetical protein